MWPLQLPQLRSFRKNKIAICVHPTSSEWDEFLLLLLLFCSTRMSTHSQLDALWSECYLCVKSRNNKSDLMRYNYILMNMTMIRLSVSYFCASWRHLLWCNAFQKDALSMPSRTREIKTFRTCQRAISDAIKKGPTWPRATLRCLSFSECRERLVED